jgi:hypothetical protein
MMSRKRLLSVISAGLFPADSSQLSKSLIRTLLRGAVPSYLIKPQAMRAPLPPNGSGWSE